MLLVSWPCPEVIGLRLYTGPGYEAINASLRANTQRFPVPIPFKPVLR